VYGEVSTSLGLQKVVIAGIGGDQQSALFGQMCVHPGQAKCTYGTGCFLLLNLGAKAIRSHNRLLTTAACQIGKKREFALEGSVFVGGAVVQWLRDGLRLVRSADEVNLLANSTTSNGGVYLVPAFTGLGAPHWDAYARGAIVGITRDTTAAHIARAALEGIAYQVADLIDAMHADTGKKLKELQVPHVNVLAVFRGFADAAIEPKDFPVAPAVAVPKALLRAGIKNIQEVELWEFNEAFSCVSLANAELLSLDMAKINTLGGAVAIGHPIGCSGARIIITLITALKHADKKIGCAAICNGGGGASACVLQRL